MNFLSLFRNATSLEEVAQILTVGLAACQSFSISPDVIGTPRPLHAYGVDPLLAVELCD